MIFDPLIKAIWGRCLDKFRKKRVCFKRMKNSFQERFMVCDVLLDVRKLWGTLRHFIYAERELWPKFITKFWTILAWSIYLYLSFVHTSLKKLDLLRSMMKDAAICCVNSSSQINTNKKVVENGIPSRWGIVACLSSPKKDSFDKFWDLVWFLST